MCSLYFDFVGVLILLYFKMSGDLWRQRGMVFKFSVNVLGKVLFSFPLLLNMRER